MKKLALLAGCTLLFLVFITSSQGFESATVESVLDGATMVLTNGEVVGYAGVRIPDTEPQNVERAAAFNQSLVSGADVRLEYDVHKRDDAGRLLAYVYVGRLFVNKELVDLGFAEVDTETENTKYRRLLFRAQKEAFERRRGLWAERFGEEGAERVEAPVMPPVEVPEAAVVAGVPLSLPDDERPLNAVALAPRLFIGDELTYGSTLTRKVVAEQGGAPREDSFDLSVEVVWRVEDIDPEGAATISQVITSVEARAISDWVSQEQLDRMRALAGRGVTVILDATGHIVSVSGIEGLLSEVPAAFHSLVYEVFSHEAPVSSEAVGVGDFWWVQQVVPFFGPQAQVNLSMDAKCMVTDFARVGQYRSAEVEMDATLELAGVQEEAGQQVGTAAGTLRRKFYAAYDEGVIARSSGEAEVTFAAAEGVGAPGQVVVTEQSEFVLREVRRGENYVARGAVPTEADRTVYVAGEAVNLRAADTTGSSVLARLERGDRLRVLARKGSWYKVKYSYPVWGWVSADLVTGEVPEEALLEIPAEGEEWQQPSAPVAEAEATPEMRERLVFYAEAEQALERQEAAAAVAEAPEGMTYIPAGETLMGSAAGEANASPEHEVFVDGFYIDRTEIANEEFRMFRPDFAFPEGEASHPVSGVSWEDANAYCDWAAKRLPTEAEWEKAARGAEGFIYPWGNAFDPARANTSEAGRTGTVPVEECPGGVSPYGVYNMAGNAAEWTASWYVAYPGNTSPDPDYGESFRVLRGGSWFTPKEQATAFSRLHDSPNSKRAYYGFRCAISPQQLAALTQREARMRELLAAERAAEVERAPAVEVVPEGFAQRALFQARKLLDKVKALIAGLRERY